MASGQVDNTIDAGFFQNGSLGDKVFNDLNHDGKQDAGEPGIAGVTVVLTKQDNTTVTTTTDANGLYSFTQLNPLQTYTVTFTTPPTFFASPSNVTITGANDANDSDPVNGVITGITVQPNVFNNTNDAGFFQCNLVSGITGPLTICANEQALFSATGAGVGATYNWTFGSGTPATATGLAVNPQWATTGEFPITLAVSLNGCTSNYNTTIVITQSVFANAGPDKDICSGSSSTINGSGPAGALYNWAVIAGDPTSIDNGLTSQSVVVSPLVTTVYQLTVTQNGCTRTDQITVFINVNKNPIANAGLNKVVTVNHPIVIGGNPTGIAPLATPNAPLGYIWSATTGLNDATIPNPSATLSTPGNYTYQVIVYSLLSGCSDTSLMQLTVLPGLKLGNCVWYDKNNNGILDAGESPIVNTSVKLYKDDNNDNQPDGAAVATTTTSALGKYNFIDLEPGNYIVGATIPFGYKVVTTNGGDPDNNLDNDNSGVNIVAGEVRSLGVTLAVGDEPATAVDGDDTNGNMTVDFGFTGNSSIGNFVFYDNNRDGIQTTGEVGIAGVVVTLTFPDGTTTATTTAADGSYNFPNLIPGNYSVAFATPVGNIPAPSNVTTAGADDTNDSDPVGGVATVTLGANETNNTIDAGFNNDCTGTIRGNVWHDVDGMTDGIIDSTGTFNTSLVRPRPSALKISLVDVNTNLVVAVTTVSGTGRYSFNDVAPGFYYAVLTTTSGVVGQASPNAKLPVSWYNTGERIGIGPGRDGQINGKTSGFSFGYDCLDNINFGIIYIPTGVGID